MSLADLTSSSQNSSPASPNRRSLAWLLPVGLLIGFLLVLALLFGARLLPAVPVEVGPVLTVRAAAAAASDTEADNASIEAAAAAKGELVFQASGWIEPDPYVIYVPTLINGIVDEVHVLEGQTVKKGDLLATLVDDDAALDLATAKQRVDTLRKQIVAHCTGFDLIDSEQKALERKIEALETSVDEAQDALSRVQRIRSGAVSEQEIVRARLAVDRERARLEEARAEIAQLEARRTQLTAEREAMQANVAGLVVDEERAQLNFDRTRISSPSDGVVAHLHVAPGKRRMLNMDAEKSAVIVELFDPEQLQARIDVPLNEAAALELGQPVEMLSDLLPDRVFSGTVTRITGQADLQRNTLQVKVHIDDPDPRMRPEMLVRAKFFAKGAAKGSGQMAQSSGRLSLYVPEAALVSETAVWVVSPDNRAELRSIEVSPMTKDGHRLVVSGLRSGESVIFPPHDALEEGSRVEISNTRH